MKIQRIRQAVFMHSGRMVAINLETTRLLGYRNTSTHVQKQASGILIFLAVNSQYHVQIFIVFTCRLLWHASQTLSLH